MNLQLENKTALVSASSGGIGQAIAQRLAQEGATVIVNGRSEASVQAAIESGLKESPNANFIPLVADLGKAEGAAHQRRRAQRSEENTVARTRGARTGTGTGPGAGTGAAAGAGVGTSYAILSYPI